MLGVQSSTALASALLASSQLLTGAVADPKSCPSGGELSCQNSTVIEDTCCFNAPGGLVLLTEFWGDEGPDDSWTIHGLWPDNCDGSYESNCDSSREYSNITAILEEQNRSELIDDLNTFWKDNKPDDEAFWAHEWNKHGTCMSTLEPECYIDYSPQEELGDYFQKTVDIFKDVSTYQTLADAGITPDSSKKYPFSDVQDALGSNCLISCDGDALHETWYFYHIRGSMQSGEYVAADPAGGSSDCPDQVTYPPKQ